jgi:hypothetical protein
MPTAIEAFAVDVLEAKDRSELPLAVVIGLLIGLAAKFAVAEGMPAQALCLHITNAYDMMAQTRKRSSDRGLS